MKLLLTAFDPFGGESVNPAQLAVSEVSERIGEIEVIKVVVPTVFGKSIQVVSDMIESVRPDVVLCIGQAGGRPDLTPERVAINVDDARIPDNEGNQPIDTEIVKGGPAAYFATIPVKAMVTEIRKQGIPASLSNSAGTFVCNHLMYGVLNELAVKYPKTRGGFMHVPFLPEQVKDGRSYPSMSKDNIVAGIEAAISAIGSYKEDIAKTEGTIQ